MIYVTSDLHGTAPAQLQQLLERAGFCRRDFLFVLGDVIDRGTHGAQLLQWLTMQPNAQLILGNHEAMLLSCEFLFRDVTEDNLRALTMHNMDLLRQWKRNGAAPTIEGFRALLQSDPDTVEGILDYLRDAPLYETVTAGGEKYILVHAGLGNFAPDKDLDAYLPHELLWERPELSTRYFENVTVVFGHTPTFLYGEEYRGKPIVTDTWINIDTGAAAGLAPTLLRLDDGKIFQ